MSLASPAIPFVPSQITVPTYATGPRPMAIVARQPSGQDVATAQARR